MASTCAWAARPPEAVVPGAGVFGFGAPLVAGAGAGGGGGGAVVVVVSGGAVVVVISTGGGAVVASAAPAALGPGGTGNSRIGSVASTPGAVGQAPCAAGAASARPSAGWTPTRPNTPTTTAKPIALTCRGQPRRSAPPLCGFPSFTLSPLPQIH